MHTSRLRRRDPLPDALEQVLALPLREDLQQMQTRSSRRRRSVDRLIERDERDVGARHAIDELNPVGQRARESIEFLDQHQVDAPAIDELEQFEKFLPAHRRAAPDLDELKDRGGRIASTRRVAQSVELRREVVALRVGGDASVDR